MSKQNEGYPVLRKLGFAILAFTVGFPLFYFLIMITWGAIAIPLISLVLISPLVLIDYICWRRKQKAVTSSLAETDGAESAS